MNLDPGVGVGAVAAEAELMCTLREVAPPQTGAAKAGGSSEAGG